MSDMAYEPVSEPPDPVEAFTRYDSAAAQAQAAALLAMAWQLSGDTLEDEEQEIVRYTGLSPEPSAAAARVGATDLEVFLARRQTLPFDAFRQQLFAEYRNDGNPVTAAALFRLSMNSPDPLVRVAAANGYLEVGVEPEPALEVLRAEAANPAELVRSVAQTSLGRVAPELQRPELPGLDYEGPSHDIESTLLLHGTFARRQAWWRPGGDFHDYVLNNVYADLYSAPDAFGWSGAYSDAARVLGASDLVQWLHQHNSGPISLMTHSHGGSVAMLASWAPLQIDRLILLSCPVHWRKYQPNFDQVRTAVSVRVHLDLVILADRGGQRFRDSRIRENVLPLWFTHSATHDPAVWHDHNVPALMP